MAKSNKLSTNILKQAHTKAFTQKRVVLTIEGEKYEVLVDQKFKVSKLQDLVSELVDKQKYLVDIDQVLSIPSYLIYLIIKFFTNIQEAKIDSFEKQLEMFNVMLDLGIVEPIMEVFPEEELKKINEYLIKATENINKFKDNPEAVHEYVKMANDLGIVSEEEVVEETQTDE